MSVADNANSPPEIDSETLRSLFSQLDARHVETFYKNYQQWQLEQQGIRLQEQLAGVEQQIVDMHVLMQLAQPSPIALATLTRLQSYGVDDIDLLDSMLERGDTWLDHTLQLLEQCERLDVIHGNYTQWCRNALEDAYNWLNSIDNNVISQPAPAQIAQAEPNDDTTEALLIQKLMSEEPVGTDVSRPPDASEVGTDLSRPPDASTTDVGTDSSRPPDASTADEERDTSVPTGRELMLVTDRQQKSPKHGFVSRMLARVWQT